MKRRKRTKRNHKSLDIAVHYLINPMFKAIEQIYNNISIENININKRAEQQQSD